MRFLPGVAFRTLLPIYLSILYLSGCLSENPATPGDNNGDPVSEEAESLGKASSDIYQNLNSFRQIDIFKSGKIKIDNFDIDDFASQSAAEHFAATQMRHALARLASKKDLFDQRQSVVGDSVIFDFTERDSSSGFTERVSLIYNTDTGVGRLFVVHFDYDDNSVVKYDSVQLVVDLNQTIFDDTDDVLLSVGSLKQYKAGQLIQEEKGSFTADAHAPGTEADGGILTSEVTYASSSFISSTTALLEFHPESGGSYEKTSNFSDGTSHMEAATFDNDGKGTFEETRRDGTHVEGSFDGAEQDGVGSYSTTTTFPDGHDPVSITEVADFTYDAVNETVNGSFDRLVRRLDGSTESESATVSQNRSGGVLVTTINAEEADGSHGFVTITETKDVDQITGEWNNADETFVVFRAQSYHDDSAHLEAELYASEVAFENDEPALATASFDFFPDGSGRGVVTGGEDIYDVIINPDGSVVITKRS